MVRADAGVAFQIRAAEHDGPVRAGFRLDLAGVHQLTESALRPHAYSDRSRAFHIRARWVRAEFGMWSSSRKSASASCCELPALGLFGAGAAVVSGATYALATTDAWAVRFAQRVRQALRAAALTSIVVRRLRPAVAAASNAAVCSGVRFARLSFSRATAAGFLSCIFYSLHQSANIGTLILGMYRDAANLFRYIPISLR